MFVRTLGRRVFLFSSSSLGKQTLIGLHFPHFTLLNWKRPILIIERHISYFLSLGEGSNSFYRANIIGGIKEDLCLGGIQKELSRRWHAAESVLVISHCCAVSSWGPSLGGLGGWKRVTEHLREPWASPPSKASRTFRCKQECCWVWIQLGPFNRATSWF